ncbi:MAG TPA: ABC-three component system protein [Candidatus Sulfotelmatobacter sp.]|nr:ABC-three component system protein [Candidatus Sulfotelmatobacter sp.]
MREWYELKFSHMFRSKLATEFQDFFTSIMELRYPSDFQKVKPYGNSGDKKCDGYLQTLKRVYQVYAPEKMQVKETNDKIEEDFKGAVKHWAKNMTSWVFVHNQWRGVPADVLQKLLKLNGRNQVLVSHWCEGELRNEFFGLSPADQSLLLGPAPTSQSFMHVQMKDIIHVVNVIAQQEAGLSGEIVTVPSGKLKANALSTEVQHLLMLGSRKSKLIKKFFGEWHDPQLGDRIAQAFRGKYEQLRSQGIVGDEAYFELWKFAGGGSQGSVPKEAAVLSVLAFLFEECEIFETPAVETRN